MALPAGAASLDEADAAIELWEHYRGRSLDPGQRLDVAVMLATREDGMWAASVTGHEKPRQSGKGDSVEVVEFWGLTQRAERILHTIHDAVLLSTETQSRMLTLLNHPDLRNRVSRSWKGTGQQMIEMRNGGIVWYRTRTGAGGRGIDEVDRLVVDEAQHAERQHLEAITPTQAVSANPQLNALGTGALEGKSAWWWSLRKQAKGTPGPFAWVGYSAQPWTIDANGHVIIESVDPHDRDLWWQTIPGLVAGRTSIDFLEREFRVLGPEGFAQEYLCVWAPPPDLHRAGPIDLDAWNGLAQVSSIESHRAWSLSVSNDRRWAALGIAGRRSDGLYHVEFMDHRPGVSWVVDRAAEAYKARGIPLRVVASGPEGALIGELREAGVDVVEVSPGENARCTGMFIDAVNARTLRHLGQRPLDQALARAVTKASTSGAQVWAEPSAGGDITTLKAVTVALGGVPEQTPVMSGNPFTDLDDWEDE